LFEHDPFFEKPGTTFPIMLYAALRSPARKVSTLLETKRVAVG